MTRRVVRIALAAALVVAGIAALGFPTDTDAPLSPAELEKNRKYYAEAYQKEDAATASSDAAAAEYESRYLRMAKAAAEAEDINGLVTRFAAQYLRKDAAVLEVGSGRGYLQDVVENYTGLDISANVSRFYHKKFVLGSATAMPFADNSFDGGWTIWVLEHVPNPEQALVELRRVMKNGAVVLMYPAFGCQSWAAQGYRVRPYSDFGLAGKLTKASVVVRDTGAYRMIEQIPNRAIRAAASWFGPTRLHYRRLDPNYQKYWEPDSDALNGLDRHEMMLWFRTRGDECLNCPRRSGSLVMGRGPLVIRLRK